MVAMRGHFKHRGRGQDGRRGHEGAIHNTHFLFNVIFCLQPKLRNIAVPEGFNMNNRRLSAREARAEPAEAQYKNPALQGLNKTAGSTLAGLMFLGAVLRRFRAGFAGLHRRLFLLCASGTKNLIFINLHTGRFFHWPSEGAGVTSRGSRHVAQNWRWPGSPLRRAMVCSYSFGQNVREPQTGQTYSTRSGTTAIS